MTIDQITLHHENLVGRVYEHDNARVIRTENLSLDQVAMAVRSAAGTNTHGRVRVLNILAHGLHGDAPDGDFVVELSKEMLTFNNATRFGRLINHSVSERIRFLSCRMASYTQGESICKQIAASADVDVVAADVDQIYHAAAPRWLSILAGVSINVGPWEGNVFKYDPSGRRTQLF